MPTWNQTGLTRLLVDVKEAPDDFAAFFESHWRRVVAALAWTMPEGEDPQDVAQEAFARAYRHWAKVRVHPHPDAWLFVTAFRLARRTRRLAARRRKVESDSHEVRAERSGADSVELAQLLAALPERQRAALVIRHYYGLSTRETARLLGCREGTVKSLLSRSRATVRAQVAQEGVD